MIVTDKDVYGQEPVYYDYNSLIREHFKMVTPKEVDLLKWILRQALKRDPEPEDFKRLTKVTTHDGHYASGYYYHLFFDGSEIGQMHFIYLSAEPTVTFNPSEIFTK